MRVGLIIETLTHLALALTTSPWVALAIFFVFGAHAFIWGTTSITVRQRAVPIELQGRVGSVNMVGVYGGLVVGSALGGVLAQHWGVTAPFWFAFVGLGAVRGADLAPAQPHRARRRGAGAGRPEPRRAGDGDARHASAGPVPTGRRVSVGSTLPPPPAGVTARGSRVQRTRACVDAGPSRGAHVVPEEPDPQGVQVLRLLDDPAARARASPASSGPTAPASPTSSTRSPG